MNTIRSVRESQTLSQQVVAFSLSYDSADGGPRGIGPEHLSEALLQMARPILRAKAVIAYGGNLEPLPPPGRNFTLDLLNLIQEEQQELSPGSTAVRGLCNFQAWPFYLSVDREKEAEWINCNQIVRITQQMAKLSEPLPDQPSKRDSGRRIVHGAICLSAMRRCMAEGCVQEVEGTNAQPRKIPKVSARIVLGGKIASFSGIMPGIFEELLITRETSKECPIFVLGGFGGAAGAIAHVLLKGGAGTDPRFTPEFYGSSSTDLKSFKFAKLLKHWDTVELPESARSPEQGLSALRTMLQAAEGKPAAFLQNGLNDDDNHRLLTTIHPTEAVRLLLHGLSRI